MFPYRDENETQRTAIVTLTLIALNVFPGCSFKGLVARWRWRAPCAITG